MHLNNFPLNSQTFMSSGFRSVINFFYFQSLHRPDRHECSVFESFGKKVCMYTCKSSKPIGAVFQMCVRLKCANEFVSCELFICSEWKVALFLVKAFAVAECELWTYFCSWMMVNLYFIIIAETFVWSSIYWFMSAIIMSLLYYAVTFSHKLYSLSVRPCVIREFGQFYVWKRCS